MAREEVSGDEQMGSSSSWGTKKVLESVRHPSASILVVHVRGSFSTSVFIIKRIVINHTFVTLRVRRYSKCFAGIISFTAYNTIGQDDITHNEETKAQNS